MILWRVREKNGSYIAQFRRWWQPWRSVSGMGWGADRFASRSMAEAVVITVCEHEEEAHRDFWSRWRTVSSGVA